MVRWNSESGHRREMARKKADPFHIPERPVWAQFLQPSSVGVLFAAFLLAYPR